MSSHTDYSSQHHPGMAIRILAVLEEVGVLELLAQNTSGLLARELAENLHLGLPFLEPICDFVSINLPTVIRKEGTRYLLDKDAFDPGFRNRLYFLLAYEPVISHLPELLRGTIKYGKDIKRRGKYLQCSSALYGKQTYEKIINVLRDVSARTIVDLGCGSGEFLMQACRNIPLAYGIGVDIDQEVVAVVRSKITANGLEERIAIIEGNITSPEEWAGQIKSKTNPSNYAFVGISVWHELLIKSEEFFRQILVCYRRHFPSSVFIAVEYNGFTLQELASLPSPYRERASFYQLIHFLTGQGLPQPPSVWLSLFKKAGIRLRNSISVKPNNLTIYNGVL